MAIFHQIGITIILYLQSLGDWLVIPMKFFTFLGEEQFFLLVMPVLYWCVDATLGLRIGVILLLSAGLNDVFKVLFHGPRPFWIDTRVKALRFENSFGVPSGHSQIAAAVWGMLAALVNRAWFWGFSLAVIFLIGLSRVVLGMHFLIDVLAGWLIGALLVWVTLRLETPIRSWMSRYNLPGKILIVLATSLALVLLGVLARLSVENWQIPAEWVKNATLAYPDLPPDQKPIDPLNPNGLVTVAGVLFGMGVGALWLAQAGGFEAGGAFWKRAARFLVGLVGVAVLYLGLAMVLPGGDGWLPQIFRYVRYALVGFWVAGLAPYLFVRIGLAERKKIIPKAR
jgi:membrane-associated phospholipid phosphatase